MLEKVRPVDSVHELWEQRSTTVLRVEHEVLSITAGWWNDKVQEVIKAKKETRKMCETSGRHR